MLLSDPLDLLYRLTPTPFQTEVRVGSKLIRVESNDARFLPQSPPVVSGIPSMSWKLIRDRKASGRLATPTPVSVFGSVVAVFLGRACLIAVDCEESQLVSFIGSQVDETQYREIVLPILFKLSDVGCDATADTECPAAY
jgi:hypothetical protein